MYHVPLAFQKKKKYIYIYTHKDTVMKIWIGRRGARIQEGREWRFPGLFYADDLVSYGKSEEDQRAMVECFVEVCRSQWR